MNVNSESPLAVRLFPCLPLPLLSPSVRPAVSHLRLPPENHSAPPDVTGYSSDSSHSHAERHHMANMGTIARNTQKYGNAERMETGDGESHGLRRVGRGHTFSLLPIETPKAV